MLALELAPSVIRESQVSQHVLRCQLVLAVASRHELVVLPLHLLLIKSLFLHALQQGKLYALQLTHLADIVLYLSSIRMQLSLVSFLLFLHSSHS